MRPKKKILGSTMLYHFWEMFYVCAILFAITRGLAWVGFGFVAIVQAQSQGAIEACRDINPPVVWRECIEKYEARERELKQDPRYQAEQERVRKEQELRANELRTQRRMIQELQQQQQQQQQRGFTCRSKEWMGQIELRCK